MAVAVVPAVIISVQAFPETIHEDDDYATPLSVVTIDFFCSSRTDFYADQWIGMWREPE